MRGAASLRRGAAGLGLLLAGALCAPAPAAAVPSASWTVQFSQNDCSGAAQQATPACESYANDRYERINYSVPNPGTADIQVVRSGYDATYLYFELDFVSAWSISASTGHHVVIELDVDPDTEANRGDYYVGIFQKSEFNTTTWIDASVQGGYETYHDANNDVGGANPLTSDYGGSNGNGYNQNIPQAADRVWARIVSGNFQIAVRRTIVGNTARVRARVTSRQSTSLSKDKLYFHDHQSTSDVQQIDNLAGLGTDQWLGVGPGYGEPDLVVLKFANTLEDPTNGTTNAKAIPGAVVRYSVQVTNTGPGSADANSVYVSDPIPVETALRVVDYDGSTAGPVRFEDGTPSSALTYVFTSLGSATDDVDFSNDGGITWTYTPADSGDGTDPAVTHVRVHPNGTLAAAGVGGNPSFVLRFKVRVL
jgi:uncharacterized repeat protein (TIGR01451 family)